MKHGTAADWAQIGAPHALRQQRAASTGNGLQNYQMLVIARGGVNVDDVLYRLQVQGEARGAKVDVSRCPTFKSRGRGTRFAPRSPATMIRTAEVPEPLKRTHPHRTHQRTPRHFQSGEFPVFSCPSM